MKKNNMALILLKKISLLFLLFSAAIFITSFAGGPSKSLHNAAWREASNHEELETWEQLRHDEVSEIHERLLKVKTNDYGRYDPTPTLAKPRFKLIPN